VISESFLENKATDFIENKGSRLPPVRNRATVVFLEVQDAKKIGLVTVANLMGKHR
jgi:hypothetical protein